MFYFLSITNHELEENFFGIMIYNLKNNNKSNIGAGFKNFYSNISYVIPKVLVVLVILTN